MRYFQTITMPNLFGLSAWIWFMIAAGVIFFVDLCYWGYWASLALPKPNPSGKKLFAPWKRPSAAILFLALVVMIAVPMSWNSVHLLGRGNPGHILIGLFFAVRVWESNALASGEVTNRDIENAHDEVLGLRSEGERKALG